MLIDWFTLGAQAVNFLILIGLLKHFLYKPILGAIDAREKLIAQELADAAQKQTEAKKERELFEKKNETFDKQHTKLLSEAKAEADAQRKTLINQAQQDSEDLRTKQATNLKSELITLHEEISRRTEEEVFAITRKILVDMSGTTLEQHLSEVFIKRMGSLSDEGKADMSKALISSTEAAVVRSAFELPSKLQTAIKEVIAETFSTKQTIRFETSPKVISGIELSTNGRKVSWSIASYLTKLEESLDKLPDKQPKVVDGHNAKTMAIKEVK